MDFGDDEEYKVILYFRYRPGYEYAVESGPFPKSTAQEFAVHAIVKPDVMRVEVKLAKRYGQDV